MAQEHQEYIQNKVNPVLESLVTQVLLERPDNPVPFMIRWLSDHITPAKPAEKANSKADVDRLKQEIDALQAEVNDLEQKTSGIGASTEGAKEADPEAEEEEEEEDDDDDCPDEMPPPPANYTSKGPRASVSAEAYGNWNKQQEYVPKVHPKTDEQKEKLKAILEKSFLFTSLEQKDMNIVVDAMLEKSLEAKERIIKEGDEGEALFVVESGILDCYKVINGEEIKVKTCEVGDAFGELALLYNCPRAASVESRESSVLWQLDRDTFNAIVKGASMKKREKYEGFLKCVTLLETMEQYERGQLVDALKPESFKAGEIIVKQGDPGDKFYIVEDGDCAADKNGEEVKQYKVGDYFGELALLKNEPRAASVTCKSDVKVLSVDRRTFKSLLGPLEDMLKRNASTYN